ncbi:hypothetical protein DPEC_G00236560 [Dallia pectoralis]|uniref:Uncharacterized protein n=1 Tax=Dallia pectoralis TaxID=75939 RepID=A0ACC2FYD2_DALPE|nr:hypothetical protein DPEC_G00236560 [Dallia pectoralis]
MSCRHEVIETGLCNVLCYLDGHTALIHGRCPAKRYCLIFFLHLCSLSDVKDPGPASALKRPGPAESTPPDEWKAVGHVKLDEPIHPPFTPRSSPHIGSGGPF